MWVFLFVGIAFQSWAQSLQQVDFSGTESLGKELLGLSVAGLYELEYLYGSQQSQGGQVGHPLVGFHFSIFYVQAFGLERSEYLFDDPAPAVPLDNLGGLFDTGNGVSGEQHPMNGCFAVYHAVRRLFYFDHIDLQKGWKVLHYASFGACKAHLAPFNFQFGSVRATLFGAG